MFLIKLKNIQYVGKYEQPLFKTSIKKASKQYKGLEFAVISA